MKQHRPTAMHQVARDLEIWKLVEGKLTERYGRKIVYDRDFLKAKRGIYQYIRGKHKAKRFNPFEKAEIRALRGQQRSLLRQIYPNPFIRLIRNLLVFAGSVLQLTGRLTWRGTKWLIPPAPKNIRAPSYPDSQSVERKPTGETKAIRQKQQSKTDAQTKSIVRKLPIKSRMQMLDAKTKGIRP